jgi:hypothetical protein
VLENLVTDLVPSDMVCFESSPGRTRQTAVWISLDEMVDFKIAMSLLELPVSGCDMHWKCIK